MGYLFEVFVVCCFEGVIEVGCCVEVCCVFDVLDFWIFGCCCLIDGFCCVGGGVVED